MSSSPYIFLRTAARRQSQRATPPFFKPWRLSSYGGRCSFQSRFLSTAAPALTSSVFQSAFLWNSIFPTPPEPKAVQHRHTYPDTTTILACSNAAVAHKKSLFRVLKELLRKCWNLVLVTVRGTEIALILSPMALFVPASVLSAQLLHTSIVSDISWAYLLKSVQVLGPAFCKLCQWIATRRDVFPPNICDRLGKLHDHGTPHSWKHTERTLKEAFGDYEAKGLTIQEVVGCGSAAQVYRGMLTTSDEDGNPTTKLVAIKVLHPHFKRLVENDMWFLQSGADLLHSLPFERIRMLNLPRAASNFGTVLRKQADLTIEGENLNRFRRNFYHTKKQENDSAILFPQAIEGWMSTKVLVEDLVYDAVPIAAYIKDGSDEVRKELAAPLLQAFLKMVFIDNWVHCDIHPGNVLIQTKPVLHSKKNIFLRLFSSSEPKQEYRRKIVFLDAGIATSLNPDDRRNLRDLFRAVILNSGSEAGRLMVERAKYERCSQIPGGIESFAKGIENIVSEFHDRRKDGLTLGNVQIGSLLSRVLDLCRVYGVEIDPAMANIVISTLVLEGLGRSLEPNMNLIDFAVPFVLRSGRV